jgi:choline dehydrogenase
MSETLVIVGGGSAGCVVASRASENSERRVILVEAGPDYPADDLPEDLRRGGRNSLVHNDWGYKHHPNAEHWRLPLPRGRVVGGSSAVNTCIALRGQPEDYDEWADRGLEDWSWEDCLPAFRRLESDLDFGDADVHGDAGPLPIRRHPRDEWTTWQRAFVAACEGLGHDRCEDTNHPGASGVGPHAMNKVDGRRISAAEAWLTPDVRGRDNLEIHSETLARRVVLEGRRAVGIEVEPSEPTGGDVETIRGDEIVLTAGAIDTPGLLLRSGIGPPADLERMGVEPRVEHPRLGARLLDHPGAAIFLLPRLASGTSRHDDLIQTCCRFSSGTAGLPNDVLMQPGSSVPVPYISLPLVSVMIALGKPAGAGRIWWESADPREKPIIESQLLEDDADRAAMCDALEHAYRVTQTPEAQEIAQVLWPPYWEIEDRDTLEERVMTICDSGYHPCGTVPMGGADDPRAVCDGRGRVRRTRGLRVADASLFPTIPSANIHLTVLMVAERIGSWLAS